MDNNYLASAISEFKRYKKLGDATFSQLNEEQFHWQYNAESNSIGTIIKHISGNMHSRWTNFFSEDGEKSWRNRESEFDADFTSHEQMMAYWEKGWQCLFAALAEINSENFNSTFYIRSEAHSITEAINRQLAHYAHHIGQIVYIGRMQKGKHWKSLSIAKGKSEEFNKEKFNY